MDTKTGKINRAPTEAGLDLPLDDLVWLRDQWLARSKVTKETLSSYERKTAYFVQWWESIGAAAEWRLTKRHLAKFEEHLLVLKNRYTGAPLAWWTRHGALRRVSEMFGWAYANGVIEGIDPRIWIPSATGAAPERTAPTVEQLWQLMDAVTTNTRYPLRNQTILALFIGTGIRLSELLHLEAQQIVFSADGSGTAAIVGKRTRANKSGKRTIAFDAFTGRYLTAYLDEMVITTGPLFFNDRSGAPLGRSGVHKMVEKAIRDAGLVGKVQSCHDLRRAFATIMSRLHPDSPGWSDIIRRQLGHKHYSQTTSYTLLTGDDLRDAVISPLATGAAD